MKVILKIAKALGRNPSKIGNIDLFKTKSVKGPGKFRAPFWVKRLDSTYNQEDWTY